MGLLGELVAALGLFPLQGERLRASSRPKGVLALSARRARNRGNSRTSRTPRTKKEYNLGLGL